MKFRITFPFILCAALTLGWAVVIFLFSAQNGKESSGLSAMIVQFLCDLVHYAPSVSTREIITFCVRKAAHMTEFGILGLLLLGTLTTGWERFPRRYPSAFAFASAYAASDELHQLFVNQRAGQVTDWLIDSIGILLFLTAWWLLMRLLRSIRQRKSAQTAATVETP